MQVTRSTLHNNQHSTVSSFLDVYYFVKLLVNKSAFEEQLRQNNIKNKLPDLFANGTMSLVKNVLLADYINNLRGNWATTYIGARNENKENNTNAADDNADTIEGQGRNMKNSNNVNF